MNTTTAQNICESHNSNIFIIQENKYCFYCNKEMFSSDEGYNLQFKNVKGLFSVPNHINWTNVFNYIRNKKSL